MKTIWENLGEQIKTWTNTAAEKAGAITKTAATKAEELSKVGRLKMDIYQLQRERGRLHTHLGRIAYQLLDGKKGALADQPGVKDLHDRIADLSSRITEKEREIDQASQMEEPVKEPAGEPPAPEKKTAPKEPSPKRAEKKPAGSTKKKATSGTRKPSTKKTTKTSQATKK
jgi:hypothetical protein